MARSTSSRRHRGGVDFAPNTERAPGLGVYAPLNVQAAPGGLSNLSRALGIVGEAAMPILAEKAHESGRKRTEAGLTAARTGSVDEKRAAQDELYRRGAHHGEAERQTLETIQQYEARYANEFDKSAGVAELVADFDAFAQESLGHYLEDPDVAPILADRLSKYLARKTTEHNEVLIGERRNRMLETVVASVAFDLDHEGETDFNGQVQKLAPFIPLTQANAVVMDAIGNYATAHGVPEILDTIPEFITREDGSKIPLRANPLIAEKIRNYRAAAQAEYDRQHAVEKETRLANVFAGFSEQLAAGVRLSWDKQLLPLVQNGDISWETAVSWYNRGIDSSVEKQSLADDMQFLLAGNRWQLTVGDLDESGNRITKERWQHALDSLVQAAPEEQQLQMALMLSRMHSLPASKFKTQLNDVIATDEALAANLQLYTTLSDQSPDLLHLYVDGDRRAQYEAMLRMQRAGMRPADIIEQIRARDRKFADEQWRLYERDVHKAIGDATLPTPGWFGTRLFGGTAVEDVVNKDYVRKRIADQARLLVENGASESVEDIVSTAAKAIYDSHVMVDLGRGQRALVERWPGAPDDLSDFMTYVRTSWLEGNEQALGLDPEDGPVTLDVATYGDSAREIVFRQNGYRVGKSIPLDQLYAAYVQAVKVDKWNAARERAARRAALKAEADRLRMKAIQAPGVSINFK